ncbi:MAG: C10 family peptidase, partial [Bacteroidales bacterium]|nr:C10 family peptidase [Bacteroidales bacterium]
IINYWEYPLHGFGTHSYHHNSYGQQSADFANTTYQYSLMPDSLDWSTPANQVDAVATLMHDCGVAVNMDYGPDASAASDAAARAAFTNHFGYNAKMAVKSYWYDSSDPYSSMPYWEEAVIYEDSEWINMLKEELDAGRPIYYSGTHNLTSGGHVFVCDGYDADTLFHFNWGWGGYYNGYFTVGHLISDDYNPGDMFTPSSGFSYNNNHQAIFVRPGNSISDTLILNMKGRTTATVDGATHVGDIYAFNDPYSFGPNYSNVCRDTLTLTPATPGLQLFVEVLTIDPAQSGISHQEATIYDGTSASGTPLMSLTWSQDVPDEPVISSTGAITIVYNGRPKDVGFELLVSEVHCLPVLKDFSCLGKDYQSATLSWNFYQQNQYASHSFNWQIEYGPQGFTPGTGTIIHPNDTIVQLTDLNADTYYEAYLTYTCVNGSTVTVDPITFNTLPLSECYDPIGNGTYTQSTLFSSAYSWIQQIYTAEELSAAGLSAGQEISILWLKYTGDVLPSRQLSVFMKNTDKTEFDNGYDWISMNSMTNVYSETATTFVSTYPDNWFPLVLSNPFVWDGHSNLAIAYTNNSGVKSNVTGYFYSNYNNYYHRTLYYCSNSNPITGTPSGNQSYYRPNIKLCSPLSCMTPTGLTTTILSRHQVRLDWNRMYQENTWNVEYGLAGFVPGTGTAVIVNDNPTITFSQLAVGAYDFYLQADCGNGETSDWVKVSVAMGDYDCAQIGTSTYYSTTQFPIGFSSSQKYSYVQQLFTAAELSAQGLAAGDNIVSLSFPYSGTPQTKSSVSVWLGNTSKTDMYDNNWIPQSDMQKVYNGSILLTDDWTTIQFADPFVWDGISSVVVAFLNNSGIDNGSFLSHQHYSWQKTLYRFSSSPVNIDNPGNPTINNYRNNIRFCKSNACVLRRDIEVALLEGDTFNFYGNMISEQGVYGHRWYVNPECDSLVVLHIFVRNIIFVTTTGAGSHDGSSWANAMELQEAMNAAATNTNKTTYLYVKKGTYLGNTSSSNSYEIKANVRAYGGFNGNEPATYDLNNRSQENMDQTILFGSNARRVLYQSADFTKARATVFDGFTIRGGTVNTVEEGGAAYIRKFCTLQNCKITANNATISGSESNVTRSGVAVYNNGGTLSNCEIYNNTVTLSGSGSGYQVNGVGVYNSNGIIDGCNIHHNTAVYDGVGNNWNVYGGGIYDYQNSEIRNTSVMSNSASQGGGIYNYGYYPNYDDSSEVRVTNCIISNNTSSAAGGGVYSGAYSSAFFHPNVKAAFTQCVFGNNAAGGEGGGVYNNCLEISFIACDIVRNSAMNGGGGVYTTVDCPLSNCIVWGNKVGASDNQLATANNKYFTMESSAVQGGYSGAITLESENIGTGIGYPNFANPTTEAGVDANNAIGDWTLQQGSVCANMGNNSFVEDIATDLGGNIRIQQGCADIGAYESGHDVAFPLHPQQESNILYVTTTGAGLQDGSSWANATPNLQYAMDMAMRYEPTATVWVAQGTYSAGKTFIAQPNVAVYGGFEGIEPYTYDLNQRDFTANTTILDGDSAYCVLNMSCPFAAADSSLFDGFSFTNGYSITNTSDNNISSASAAFLLANIEMRNCIFKNSLFSNTGNGYQPNVAVYAKECIFDNCTFSDNDGYGLYGIGVTVRNCIAEHNNHYGIRARGNSLVENCVLQYNRSGLSIGGGKAVGCTIQENGIGFGHIFNDNYSVSSSDAQIINSNIINNRTNGLSASGGLYENLNISNNSVVRTSVYTYFGGVRAQNHARFINCNIVNNFVSRGSYSSFDEIYGGVYNYTSDNEYTNCIIWGNRLDNNYENNISGDGTFSYCAIEGGHDGIANINLAADNDGTDSSAAYVRFVNPTATAGVTTQDSVDYRLNDGSACINMGNLNTTSLNLPTYDLSGSLRIKQNHIDIGAYEFGDVNYLTVNDTICLGESFFYNDYFVFPETPGLFRDTLIYNEAGNDYIAYINLMVNETYNINVEETICEGETFYFNGQPRTTTGFYTAYLQSSAGCDSTVTLHLIVNPILHNNFNQTACDSFTWNQTTYYTTGDYTQTFEAVTGCD